MKLPVGARKPGLGFRAVFGRCLFPAVLLLLFLDAALSDRLLSSHLRHRRLSLRTRSHPAPSFLSTPDRDCGRRSSRNTLPPVAFCPPWAAWRTRRTYAPTSDAAGLVRCLSEPDVALRTCRSTLRCGPCMHSRP